MRIRVKWSASDPQGTENFGLGELDCGTEKEWNDLSADEQHKRIVDALDNMPEGPYRSLDSFEAV